MLRKEKDYRLQPAAKSAKQRRTKKPKKWRAEANVANEKRMTKNKYHKIETNVKIILHNSIILSVVAKMSANRILSIYKARTTILAQMEHLNYDVTDYNTFSINEVDAMAKNQQLDLFLTHTADTSKKVYIKFYVGIKTGNKQIRTATLDTIIEDLYEIEKILTTTDTLVVVIDEEPNDTIRLRVKYLFEKYKIFVVIHNLKRLQFNILEHNLMPDNVEIVTNNEALVAELNIKDIYKLPEISRFDPLALAIMLRPNEVMKCMRQSITALRVPYYRVCI